MLKAFDLIGIYRSVLMCTDVPIKKIRYHINYHLCDGGGICVGDGGN